MARCDNYVNVDTWGLSTRRVGIAHLQLVACLSILGSQSLFLFAVMFSFKSQPFLEFGDYKNDGLV